MKETVWNAQIDLENVPAIIIEHLQYGSVWFDSNEANNEKTLVSALTFVQKHGSDSCIAAFQNAEKELVQHPDLSIRESMLYIIQQVDLLGADALSAILEEHWDLYNVPISSKRNSFQKYAYEVFIGIIGNIATLSDTISVQLLRKSLAQGQNISHLVAKIDPVWLSTDGAQYVPQNKWLGGVLLQMPSDELRLQLIENMAPWHNAEDVLSLRFWSLLRGDVASMKEKIRSFSVSTPPAVEHLRSVLQQYFDNSIIVPNTTELDLELISDPFMQSLLVNFTQQQTHSTLTDDDGVDLENWYKKNHPKEYHQLQSLFSQLSKTLHTSSEKDMEKHLMSIVQEVMKTAQSIQEDTNESSGTTKMAGSNIEGTKILESLHQWLQSLTEQLQHTDIDTIAEQIDKTFSDIYPIEPLVDKERIHKEIQEELRINMAIRMGNLPPLYVPPDKPKT